MKKIKNLENPETVRERERELHFREKECGINVFARQNGITLVALVVTIVILLVLAGVSINLVLGQNGIVAKAKDAEDATLQGQENTQAELNNLYDEMEILLGEKTPLPKVDIGQKATDNSTIDGEYGTYSNPIIPKGYIAVNVGDAEWDAEDGPKYNSGLVITDEVDSDGKSTGNEWVWVPVEEVSTMYTVGEKTLLGTSGETAVKTPGYSNLRVREGDSYTTTTPGNASGLREPDLLSSFDTDNRFYNILNYATKEEMGQAFVEDYKAMIDSVSKYHGFYIGRYELSGSVNNPAEKSGTVITNQNWYSLYKACRSANLKGSDKVQTTMIWGCQWDETMSWLKNTVFKDDPSKVDSDSSSWGNYSDYNTANGYVDGDNEYVAKAGSKQTTGYSEYWKANNIYDLAGNCLALTQEAYSYTGRAAPGGYCTESGSTYPASSRLYDVPTNNLGFETSRAALYVR